jgi:uncharacterized protein YndB with AHSA1/START domain
MTLTVTLEGETRVIITRAFAAPPARVWAAHTDPALIRRWCYGFDGWEMPECTFDARVGGSFRWVWAPVGGGDGFYATGEILVFEPTSRMVHVERMFMPDPTPDNHIETLFQPDGTGTRLILTMTLPSAEAREAMLATGMTDGMEITYARIDGLVQPAA